ncbi:hypothetical protein ASG73_01065 [Janibacter sp. Soil728]|nr:hypothetical protein ASG73_01065 [Janibacter sp. Soil728]
MLALVLPLLVLLGVLAPSSAAAQEPRDVIVIGAPGLSWSDVTAEATPAIHSFAGSAAITNLNVRSTYFTSCPADGWLGLSAGNRAAVPRDVTREELRAHPRALPHCGPLPSLPESGPELTAVELDRGYWQDLSKGVAAQGFKAQIGTLGTAVREAGGCIAGSGAGAVLAMADRDGVVPSGEPGINETCAITLAGAPPVSAPQPGEVRTREVAAVDAVVADVVAGADSQTVIVLAGLSDDGGQPGLRVLAMAGAGIRPGWLHSDSTTRDEMAQVADVTHTVLTTAGMSVPEGLAGRQLVPVADASPVDDRIASLVDDDAQLRAADEVIPPFFRGFGIGLVALLAAAGLAWGFGPRRWRPVVSRGVGLVGLAAMAVPASTYLVTLTRWFDSTRPMTAFVLRLTVIDLTLLALALAVVWAALRWSALRWRAEGPAAALISVGVVSAVTFLLLAGDLLLAGGRMTMLSVLGLLPLDGGRFHGFGNVPFAIFVAAAFLLMAALADPLLGQGRRRLAVVVVAVVGLTTFVVDAWLGADGGGALALIPSVGYLVLAVAGVRLTWPRLLGIAVATGVGFLAMAGADWLRPEEKRTHLGRFFQSLLDGDAWGIVGRKLQTNVDLLLGPERAALLVPVALIALIWVLARPGSVAGQRLQPIFEAYPALRVGLIGLVVALTVGFLLNDSGTAIPAAAALVLGPALLVLWSGQRDAT